MKRASNDVPMRLLQERERHKKSICNLMKFATKLKEIKSFSFRKFRKLKIFKTIKSEMNMASKY